MNSGLPKRTSIRREARGSPVLEPAATSRPGTHRSSCVPKNRTYCIKRSQAATPSGPARLQTGHEARPRASRPGGRWPWLPCPASAPCGGGWKGSRAPCRLRPRLPAWSLPTRSCRESLSEAFLSRRSPRAVRPVAFLCSCLALCKAGGEVSAHSAHSARACDVVYQNPTQAYYLALLSNMPSTEVCLKTLHIYIHQEYVINNPRMNQLKTKSHKALSFTAGNCLYHLMIKSVQKIP